MPDQSLYANSYQPAKRLLANWSQFARWRGDTSLSNSSWPFCELTVLYLGTRFPNPFFKSSTNIYFKLWNTLNIQKGINNNIMNPSVANTQSQTQRNIAALNPNIPLYFFMRSVLGVELGPQVLASTIPLLHPRPFCVFLFFFFKSL